MTTFDWSRFFAGRTDEVGDCWEFSGSRDPNGYGRVRHDGATRLAHRVSYQLAFGQTLTPEVHVCHRCDNPPCIRPDHLWLGDDIANHADMVLKGRSARRARHSQAKLTEADVAAIRAAKAAGERSADIAARFGISKDHVSRLARGARWPDQPVSA